MPSGIYTRNSALFKRRPLADRFWEKVDKNGPAPTHCPELGPCYVWTGARHKNGYGQVSVGGKVQQAHRVGWELENGPMPPDKFACHHCDNRPCVRAGHIYAGTKSTNIQDAMARGRMTFAHCMGERNPRAKLTEQDVRQIRSIYARGSITFASLGRTYHVSYQNIRDVIRGRVWKHVGADYAE